MSETPHELGGPLPHTRLSQRIDRWIEAVGSAVSWLWLVLLATIVLNVVMRYVFGEGRIEFEELQWHLYAMGFLTALSYGVVDPGTAAQLADLARFAAAFFCAA